MTDIDPAQIMAEHASDVVGDILAFRSLGLSDIPVLVAECDRLAAELVAERERVQRVEAMAVSLSGAPSDAHRTAGKLLRAALAGAGAADQQPEPTHANHETRDMSDDGYCYRCGDYR